MSASTSPIKEEAKDWVKFDEADGALPSASSASPDKNKSSRSSSGVSSARGSVNSAVIHEEEPAGGVLPVSEVQVVDEESLRKKAIEAVAQGPPSSNAFRQMQPAKLNHASNVSLDNMDNVNLSDDGQSPTHVRGRQFRKYLLNKPS